METGEGESSLSRENLVATFKEAPRIIDLILEQRTNKIKSNKVDPVTFKKSEREFSESEGIENLIDFIETTIETAHVNEDTGAEETARLFKDNLRFVGEEELKEATQGIAQHLVDEAKKGKEVIVYPANVRSERYIALRILEEIDYLTEQTLEVRERIRITESLSGLVERSKQSSGNCLIAVTDDFVISGTRIQGSASKVFNELVQEGILPDQASSMIEANVVALPQRRGERLTVGSGEKERDLRTFGYFRFPEYRGSDGKWVVNTGISLTGSHSSADYGFETVLEDFQKYLKSKSVEKEIPLLYQIVRPYEMEDNWASRNYKDKDLQKRWGRIQKKYGKKNYPGSGRISIKTGI